MTTRFVTAAVHATTAVVVGGAVQRSTAQPAFALPRGALDDETVRLAAISRRAAELDLRGFAQRANVERQKFLRRQKDAADRRDRRSYDAAKRELEKYDAQMREKIEGILYPGLPAGALGRPSARLRSSPDPPSGEGGHGRCSAALPSETARS